MRSFKSNENIHKKEGGSYYVVSANKASNCSLKLQSGFLTRYGNKWVQTIVENSKPKFEGGNCLYVIIVHLTFKLAFNTPNWGLKNCCAFGVETVV